MTNLPRASVATTASFVTANSTMSSTLTATTDETVNPTSPIIDNIPQPRHPSRLSDIIEPPQSTQSTEPLPSSLASKPSESLRSSEPPHPASEYVMERPNGELRDEDLDMDTNFAFLKGSDGTVRIAEFRGAYDPVLEANIRAQEVKEATTKQVDFGMAYLADRKQLVPTPANFDNATCILLYKVLTTYNILFFLSCATNILLFFLLRCKYNHFFF